ncbi:MAG TPA: helix-turn-helix transcriptional regulator [Jatrophihabitantaceae bacterium]|nr:helix-turn-helix transcriptional regulator [Jatrophihabitantaceae bacterium]
MAATDALARIEQLCGGTLSAKRLREEILRVLRSVLPFDAYYFGLTDPVTRIAASPLADVPMLPWPLLPELVRWRYQTRVGRWTDMIDDGTPATSLLAATGGQPGDSLMWHHVQRQLGVLDTAMTPFADKYGCWGLLDLWRTTGEPFSTRELRLLGSLAPIVAEGLRRAVARTFVDAGEQLLRVGPAVVVVGGDLVVRQQTKAAADALLQLNPPDEPMAPIPAAVYNVGAALIATEQGVWTGEPWSRIHLGGGRWLTVKASRLGQDIAVSIESCTPTDRTDVYARAHALSPREAEVLALLGLGLDSREIAVALVLSEHTVNDHVKSILAKTGARTRQVLLSRAVGT